MKKFLSYLIESIVSFGVVLLLEVLFSKEIDWLQIIIIPILAISIDILFRNKKEQIK